MKEKKYFSDDFFKEIFKLIVIILVFIILGKHTEMLQDNRAVIFFDSLIIIVTSLAYFVIINIVRIVTPPVSISVSLRNHLTGQENTTLYGSGVTREDLTQIDAEISVLRTSSAWHWLGLNLIKNSSVGILICTEPEGKSLICTPQVIEDELDFAQGGFIININNILKSNLVKGIPMKAYYSFSVADNRDNPIKTIKKPFPIKPTIMFKQKQANFFHRLVIRLEVDSENGVHIINYIR